MALIYQANFQVYSVEFFPATKHANKLDGNKISRTETSVAISYISELCNNKLRCKIFYSVYYILYVKAN